LRNLLASATEGVEALQYIQTLVERDSATGRWVEREYHRQLTNVMTLKQMIRYPSTAEQD